MVHRPCACLIFVGVLVALCRPAGTAKADSTKPATMASDGATGAPGAASQAPGPPPSTSVKR